ncbi:MAG: hypothetical protein ACOY3Y_07335, partial [Acidobacteriota bacterium]
VKLREKNLVPTTKRLRVNKSQADQFVLRSERRRDGSGVTTLDGALTPSALAKESSFLSRASGIKDPQVDRKSATLDGARVLVSSRVMREIARKAHAR